MTDFLWNLGSFIIALGILITVHEYGHFWVARRCGVKVERFSIGFGKAIWRKVGQDGTEYVLALIPLGGYVKMLDERVDEVPESLKDHAFNRKSVWQRIAIVAAGPLANFIFAIIVLYFMYMIGVPSVKPVISGTILGTPAAQIDVKEPMLITSVGGKSVSNWEDVTYALVGHIGDPKVELSLTPVSSMIEVNDSTIPNYVKQYTLNTENWQFDPEKEFPATSLGLISYRPEITPVLSLVTADGAAAAAGIKVGDKLIATHGQPYVGWKAFVEVIKSSANVPLEITVQRASELLTFIVTPHEIKMAKEM